VQFSTRNTDLSSESAGDFSSPRESRITTDDYRSTSPSNVGMRRICKAVLCPDCAGHLRHSKASVRIDKMLRIAEIIELFSDMMQLSLAKLNLVF